MIFSKRSHEGYLMIDHRASPGIPAPMARQLGVDPRALGEHSFYEAPTLGCQHCGSAVVMNPARTRERSYCPACDRYICDWCEAARKQPDYVHRTINQIHDLLQAGWTMAGGSMSNPVLLPPKGLKNG